MTTPRIVYAGFATARHSGGVHVLTQHVRLLRAAGRDARLWLPDPGRRTDWIDPDLPVVFGATLPVRRDDLLVLPETPTIHGRDPAPGARKVLFNQNHFYTYAAGAPARGFPGWSPPPAVWTVSTESRDVLAAVLPSLPVTLVPNPVDGELFRPRPTDHPTVTWFPRKRPREASLLRELLTVHPGLAGVELVELAGATRSQVAETLGRATVMVALGHSEGFGLPVAEALASGCLVVGYDGGGGHELFEAPGAFRVPEQRPLLLRDRVVDLVQRADVLRPERAANRAWVLERYPFSRTETAVLAAVDAALARPGDEAVATHPAAWLDVLGADFTAYG